MSTITILDGGMGKELRRIGAPFRQPEWSALALIEAPDFVAAAHRNFIEAGADVIITNTYAVVPFHLGSDRFETDGEKLVELAACLARESVGSAERPVQVAGSLPPLFGSYVPDQFDPAAAPDLWRTLITPQIVHVDFWLGETISSTAEAGVLLQTLNEVGDEATAKPVWLSFTLMDAIDDAVDGDGGRAMLRSGEPISAVAKLLAAAGAAGAGVEAVLFNCSQPEVMRPALAELAPLLPNMALGAYANGFADHNALSDEYSSNAVILEGRPDLTPDRYSDLAAEWVDAGATMVGGCCEIYPEHIAALATRFRH